MSLRFYFFLFGILFFQSSLVSTRHVRREAEDPNSKEKYEDLLNITIKTLIKKNPTNVTITPDFIKSDVLPRMYESLQAMEITDDKLDSFKKNARRDLSEAKVEELIDLLTKLRKSKLPKDTYFEELELLMFTLENMPENKLPEFYQFHVMHKKIAKMASTEDSPSKVPTK